MGIGLLWQIKSYKKVCRIEQQKNSALFHMKQRTQTVDKAALGCKSQSHFLISRIAYKIEVLSGSPSFRSPLFDFVRCHGDMLL